MPKVYGQIISENLNLKLENLAENGSDNQTILEKIGESISKMKKDDVVILQWTDTTRFRLVNDKNEWKFMILNSLNYLQNLEDFSYISEKTVEEILINRSQKKFQDELYSIEKIVKKALYEQKLITFSPMQRSIVNSEWALKTDRITIETNGAILDDHYSEIGHMQVANRLIRILSEKKLY